MAANSDGLVDQLLLRIAFTGSEGESRIHAVRYVLHLLFITIEKTPKSD